MKTLNPSDYVTTTISESETKAFEAFLDRNVCGWREHEMLKAKNAGTITRAWYLGIDGIERSAIFRKQYVEIYDRSFEFDAATEDVDIHLMKRRLCDIHGDLTPDAVWAQS